MASVMAPSPRAHLPLPACGERVGVRGSGTRRRRREPLPLTLTLASPCPKRAWGEGISQLLGIELGIHLAPERLGELVGVAADVLGQLLPLLDVPGVGVEDGLRVLDAEALGDAYIALALAGLVLGHQLVEVLADRDLLHAHLVDRVLVGLLVPDDEVANGVHGRNARRGLQMDDL